MLSSWDDYPVHQIPEPIRYVGTSDRNFYDRYYFNMHGSSDELFLVFGLGQYPNLGVQDAFAGLRAGGGDTLVFTSGGAISVMLQAVLGLTDANCFALNAITLNSSVTRLLYRPGEVSLHSFNNTAHLDVHNEAALLTYR